MTQGDILLLLFCPPLGGIFMTYMFELWDEIKMKEKHGHRND
jgi:hypothetical protein